MSSGTIARLNDEEMAFFEVTQPPLELCGFGWFGAERLFCRLPQRILEDATVNDGVKDGAWRTAGGRVRFRTNARCIGVRVDLREKNRLMPHMARSGSCGCDLYFGRAPGRYAGSAMPPAAQAAADKYERIVFRGERAWRDATLNLPLYNGVTSLWLALDPEAELAPPRPLALERPVLFYGSSITQGACASRPGTSYTAMLANWLDIDYLNLGFSGSAKGEPALADAIASLDLAGLVLDYDHNAPDPEHLERTHAVFFDIIRAHRPHLPVLLVSRPNFDGDNENNLLRREIVRRTYAQARQAGDRRVWFVDGEGLFGVRDRDLCTVDGCHPNDLGFYRMAEHIRPALERMLGLRPNL